MPISKKSPAASLGGIVQRFRSRDLRTAMSYAGFDPAADGSEWVLIISDPHITWDYQPEFDPLVFVEVEKLRGIPRPIKTIILGDILTNFVGSFGSTGYDFRGEWEAERAVASLDRIADLAPIVIVLGNHDTKPDESPLGGFCRAHLDPYFPDNHTAFDAGGVRWVCLSTSHDANLDSAGVLFLENNLNGLNSTQECVIGIHQPGGGRGYDYGGFMAVCETAGNTTNNLWQISGHDHAWDNGSLYQLNKTTLIRWRVGSAARWAGSDGTTPSLGAVACRGGNVVARFAWDGKDGYWFMAPDFPRNGSATTPPKLYDGLAGQTVLSTYQEGGYDRSGRFNNAATNGTPATYRIAGNWLAACYDLAVNFPIPVGATKFWFIITGKPTELKFSNSNGSFQTIMPIPDLVDSACIVPIPEGLRSGDFLFIQLKSVSAHISAWGFAE